MKKAGAKSEKEKWLNIHFPDTSLMPFRLCNCLQQTTRKFFFSLKQLWRPDNLSFAFYAFEPQ